MNNVEYTRFVDQKKEENLDLLSKFKFMGLSPLRKGLGPEPTRLDPSVAMPP